MKKQILNLGKALNKAEQKSINGGEGGPRDTPNSRGCYEQPVSNVDCVGPWFYAFNCGYICMLAPVGPNIQ